MNRKIIFTIVVILFGGSTDLSAQSYEMFVSSRNTSSVKFYDGATGAYKGNFVPDSSGGLSATQEVAFGPDGHLYVSGRENLFIKKYDGVTGEYLGNFTIGYLLDGPTKMTFGPDGNLYVSQWGPNKKKVVRFNATTGLFVDEFTSIDLNAGCGHAWDAEGNLYVASFGSSDVRKFDPNGVYLGVFAEAGHLTSAINLWFDNNGDLLVVDFNAGSVLRFDGATGAYKSVFISGMNSIEGVAFGPDGLIYLTDWRQNEIVRYDSAGVRIGVFTTAGGMLQPNSITFAPTNRTVSVRETHGNLPLNLELKQNYPNPFNPRTLIKFSLFKSGPVTLNIYDIRGRLVSTLINEILGEGEYSKEWDGKNMRSGLYFYQLTAGNITETKKMILLK